MNVSEITVICKLNTILQSPEEIRNWLHLNLRQFQGKTALQLIRAGRTREVLQYLDAAIEQLRKERHEALAADGISVNEEVTPNVSES